MTTSAWPALGSHSLPADEEGRYERGIWGKVHGQASDFRWIARSDGFGQDKPDLGKLLNLGGEEVPAIFQAWLNLGDRCYAVTCYPSRAIDASGRRDFLEKQVLEWRRPEGMPAAWGALLLLPHVARLTDEIWWERYSGQPWTQPDFSLPLAAVGHKELDTDLAHAIERGREDLRRAVPPKALEQLYDQLLERRRPAFLAGLDHPLSAQAIAALLLPLPREIADRISLAGWIPTGRPAYDALANRWDVLVTGPDLAVPALPAPSQIKAWYMAEQLLAHDEGLLPDFLDEEEREPRDDPALSPVAREDDAGGAPLPPAPSLHGEPRPGLELDLSPPDPRPRDILDELYRFARSADRRWLSPEMLKKAGSVPRFSSQEPAARRLWSWVRQVREQRPAYADPEQWAAKVDLLRSAALVLVPEPETYREISPFDAGSHVPALLFGLLLENRSQWDSLAGLGDKILRQLLEQSLTCRGSKTWTPKLRRWLEHWRSSSQRRDVNVQNLIGEAFRAHPK
jgi:hypothetical protein